VLKGADMGIGFCVGLAVIALVSSVPSARDSVSLPSTATSIDTIRVAAPTGVLEVDRASIVAAFEQVRPGGTVQFAPGTYVIGAGIPLDVPRVALLGHVDGTTLRGCDPASIVDHESLLNCNGFELSGGLQTVQNLTFEYVYAGLYLGCCLRNPVEYRTVGGDRVVGNTFRHSGFGVLTSGSWPEPAVIHKNRFVNTFHGVAIYGGTVHVLDNEFSVPEPEQVQATGYPGDAISLSPLRPLDGGAGSSTNTCANNLVAGNRIEGSPQGIRIINWGLPGTVCRHAVIRDNTIMVRGASSRSRERADSSATGDTASRPVGVPIALLNLAEGAVVEGHVIEGNRIDGGEGLGIEILRSSRNIIANNNIGRIDQRNPFPGNAMGLPVEWHEGNGSGIWVSPGSEANEISCNLFEDIARHAVVIEGDSNVVAPAATSEAVRDLGRGNRISDECTRSSIGRRE
jgi:parallel beta-helix repeat protein